MKIGFIGLGVMGAPMAEHLLDAGHEVLTLTHRSPLPQALADKGITVCASAQEIGKRADIVITMLPNTPQVEQVLFGADGVASGLAPGRIVIDMSTISPAATKDFAARIEKLGCSFLDAPVSGGDVGAKNATLTIMAGGDADAFECVRPVLETMGKNITHVGPAGSGQICKLANQIIVAGTIGAVAEALVFASKAGADPEKTRQALMGGFAASRVLDVHGRRMLDRNFEPGFRVVLHQKDLGLALDNARGLGVSLPMTGLVQELFNACAGDLDHSALLTALEKLAGHKIMKEKQRPAQPAARKA